MVIFQKTQNMMPPKKSKRPEEADKAAALKSGEWQKMQANVADTLGYYLPPYNYAIGQMLEQAITATKSLDHKVLAEYLRKNEMKTIVGNIKFDFSLPPSIESQRGALRQLLGAGRPVWIAGSTHAVEEDVLLDAHRLVQRGRFQSQGGLAVDGDLVGQAALADQVSDVAGARRLQRRERAGVAHLL